MYVSEVVISVRCNFDRCDVLLKVHQMFIVHCVIVGPTCYHTRVLVCSNRQLFLLLWWHLIIYWVLYCSVCAPLLLFLLVVLLRGVCQMFRNKCVMVRLHSALIRDLLIFCSRALFVLVRLDVLSSSLTPLENMISLVVVPYYNL